MKENLLITNNPPLIIGVAGGSGSGKTTFARALIKALGEERASLMAQDSYYIDQSKNFDRDGGAVNFDHPSAIDFELMAIHLNELKAGREVAIPLYDFATHRRQTETKRLKPCSVIIVDGILIFSNAKLFKYFDYSIYVDCDEELRFERRLKRDVKERGRDPEGVREQFYKQVAPMHNQFVAPSMKYASHQVCERDFDVKLKGMIELLSGEIS